jgi:cytochrome o ubiquinol oxidase subunit IV
MDKHEIHFGSESSLRSYLAGYLGSVLITSTAFLAVTQKWFEGGMLALFVVGLAVTQLIVQLIFFLHLGREERPRWNLTIFFFAILIISIIVVGTLWIMFNLNYNMMPGVDEQIIENEIIKTTHD